MVLNLDPILDLCFVDNQSSSTTFPSTILFPLENRPHKVLITCRADTRNAIFTGI